MMTIVAILSLISMNVVNGESSCIDDQDCSSDKYCYNVSGQCVEFTKCQRYNRMDGKVPARQPSQCGPCRPEYKEELLGTGVHASSCIKKTTETQETELDSVSVVPWPWLWIGIISVAVICLGVVVIWLARYVCKDGHSRIFEKVSLFTRPTAPPQDDSAFRLRVKSYSEEEFPPIYSSIDVGRDRLVNAVPTEPPDWVRKPHYDPDYNDNVADGVAMPVHNSSTNIPIELDNEEETNPSSWTPDQGTANVPNRPFALFATEQRENEANTALAFGNCPPNSRHEESSNSDDGSGGPEDTSRARAQGDVYRGPNVQINQIITLNIAQSGTK